MFFKKPLSPSQFWEWFSREESRLFGLDQGRFAKEFTKQLWRYDKDLVWEMTAPNVSSKRELAISADGIKASIPSVKRLVGAAPRLQQHEIVAFRQPSEADGIELEGNTLSTNTILFEVLSDRLPADVDLFVPGVSGSSPPTKSDTKLIACAFILLDASIGEYAVMTKVKGIEFRPLIHGAGRTSALPLAELSKSIEKLERAS